MPAGLAGCTKKKATTAAAPARPAERSALTAPLRPGAAQDPEKLKQAAATLALYCQSIASSWPSSAYGNAWLPAEARAIGGTVSFSENSVQIYKGDREHTHGYLLRRTAPAGPSGSQWELAELGEDGARPVLTLTLPSGAHLELAELVRRAQPEYDRRIQEDPHELRLHQERALFLLTFPYAHHRIGDPPQRQRTLAADRRLLAGRQEAARAALLDSAERLPEHFWPVLMLALLDSAAGAKSAAAARQVAWAEQHKSFSALSHLAQFYRLTGQLPESCAAEQRALSLPMREEPGDLLNGSALGYEVAAAAYRGQHYACAEQVARSLREKEPDRYTRGRFELPLRALQAAAAWAQRRPAEARALVASDGLREKDPFYRDQSADLPGLAQALQRGDTAAIRSWLPAHTGLFEDAAFNSLDLPALLGLGG